MGVRLRLPTREMAAARPLLALLLLLGAVLAVQGRRHARYLTSSSNQRELLKEAGTEIDHGPVGYTSQHKQHRWQKTGHKGHVWANKFKGGLKKRRFGDPEEKHPKVTDTDEEEEHAEAQQEDGQDVQEDAGEAEASEEEGEV